MVVLHTGLLVGCVVEVVLADRPFLPWLGWPMLAVVAGRPGAALVVHHDAGPAVEHPRHRRARPAAGRPAGRTGWLRHPNYVAVVAEGVALPLVHTAWVTALVFTVLNAWLLTVRIARREPCAGTRRLSAS